VTGPRLLVHPLWSLSRESRRWEVSIHDDGDMSFNFRPVLRDQLYLMPPSVADWLPADHLAWAVLTAVEQMQLDEFLAVHREDGRGGAAYDPSLIVGLVLYAYCVGERSSRRIERRCQEDVGFRVVAANTVPDHATLARFIVRHENALAALFCDVLELCARAGMVDVGVVAIDGTKIAADAAGDANRSLSEVARRALRDGIQTDAEEDERCGETRGDELPVSLRSREWIERAMEDIAAERRRSIERRPNAPRHEPKVNLTDPDSRIMRRPQGFVQGYNAQAAVSRDQVIVAAAVLQEPVDTDALQPMVIMAKSGVAHVRKDIGTVVADAGYWSPENGAADLGVELLIATHKREAIPGPIVDVSVLEAALKKGLTGEMTHRAAAIQFGMPKTNFTRLVDAYRQDPKRSLARSRMMAKLAQPRARQLYRQRATTVEPVFGQIKSVRGFARFRRRGLGACAAEWAIMVTTHNLLKWWRRGGQPQPA
jgi:transposase